MPRLESGVKKNIIEEDAIKIIKILSIFLKINVNDANIITENAISTNFFIL